MTEVHFRTLVITMNGGSPWGFRLIGGASKPLRISKIRRRSKAHQCGLQPGDVLNAVNGISCSGASHEYAMQLISRCSDTLTLELGREAERVLVFHNDVADYEEPDEQNAPEPERTHVSEVQILPDLAAEEDEELAEAKVMPASEDVTPVPIEKLTKEASPEPVPSYDRKVYGDSSFFNDPAKNFPTIEEEKEMARRVALALTDARNKTSRGANMFEKRRLRSAKWISSTEDEVFNEGGESQLAEVQNSPKPFGMGMPGTPIAPPPPPAPGPPKSVQEFVEEMKRAPKSKHNVVPPNKCFDIAAALHNNEGRGAQIFARRRAKSEKWVVEQPDDDEESAPPPQPVRVFPPARDPIVVTRIGGMRQLPQGTQSQPFGVNQTRTQTRLPLNANQTVLVQNRFSMVEGGSPRLVETQTSLAVAKMPSLQSKTFNTQPKGWRPVA